jgi:hypothetical protein
MILDWHRKPLLVNIAGSFFDALFFTVCFAVVDRLLPPHLGKRS